MIETPIEADETIEQIKHLQEQIKSAEQERDAFKSHYQAKIAAAEQICTDKTDALRTEIALLTEELKRFAVANLPADRKTIALPTGTLQFRKSPTRYFYDDLKPANQDPRLISFVKHNAHEYYKVQYTESVDWAKFKANLKISDDGDVYLEDTGEIIDGLRAQRLPDTFKVEVT